MLKRYFLSNILLMLLLNLLVKPIWIFVIDRNVQLNVGHEEYGLYNALFSFTLIFNILLDVGITNFNNRYIASDQQRILSSLPNILAAKGLLSLVYFFVLFVVAISMGYSGRSLKLLGLLALVQLLNSLLQYLRSNISASQDFKIDSVISVVDKLLMVFICGTLLFLPSFKPHFVIEWFVYAQIVAYSITIALALAITITRYTRIRMQHFSLSEMMRLCKVSVPYAILILLMGIYMRSDSLLLERMQGAAENGIYAQAYRILDAANTFGLLFAGMLLSMFSRIISKKLPVGDLVKTSANMLMPVSLACVAFCLIYAKDIMYLLYNDASQEGSQLFMFVFACFPAFSLMYIYSTLLTANGSISLLIKIALIGCILSIGTNFILIPRFHAKGAAMSAFLVEWVLAFLYIYFSHRTFELPSYSKWIFQFVFFFIIILAANWALKFMGVPLFWGSAINLLLFVATSYMVGLWNRAMIESYIGQYKSNS